MGSICEGIQSAGKLTVLLLVVIIVCIGGLYTTWRHSRALLPRRFQETIRVPVRNIPERQRKQKFIIAIDWTGYTDTPPQSYLEGNCLVTRDRSLLAESHAVVITHRKQTNIRDYPKFRKMSQRWVWLIDENPYHAFMGHNFGYSSIRNTFNWTMTYRTSSEVYMPYGWTTRRENPEPIPNTIGNRTRLVAAVISNCDSVHNGRYEYVKKLNASLRVDVYGMCVNKLCEGHTGSTYKYNCPEVRHYLFYIAFENSNCKEYITEKPFSHGFGMGAVPIVMGASKAAYLAVTPPNSFIYAPDFTSPAKLAEYLVLLSRNKTDYMKYHEWRRHYTTSYRVHYNTEKPMWESLCRALRNDSGKPNTYADLGQFWTKKDCLIG